MGLMNAITPWQRQRFSSTTTRFSNYSNSSIIVGTDRSTTSLSDRETTENQQRQHQQRSQSADTTRNNNDSSSNSNSNSNNNMSDAYAGKNKKKWKRKSRKSKTIVPPEQPNKYSRTEEKGRDHQQQQQQGLEETPKTGVLDAMRRSVVCSTETESHTDSSSNDDTSSNNNEDTNNNINASGPYGSVDNNISIGSSSVKNETISKDEKTQRDEHNNNVNNYNASALSSFSKSWMGQSWWKTSSPPLGTVGTACHSAGQIVECRDDDQNIYNDNGDVVQENQDEDDESEDWDGPSQNNDDDDDPRDGVLEHYQKIAADMFQARDTTSNHYFIKNSRSPIEAKSGLITTTGAAHDEEPLDPIFASRSWRSDRGDDDDDDTFDGDVALDDNDDLLVLGPSRSILDDETFRGNGNGNHEKVVDEKTENKAAVGLDGSNKKKINVRRSRYSAVPFDEVSENEKIPLDVPFDEKESSTKIPPPSPKPLWVRNHDKRNELAWIRCAARNREKPMKFPISRHRRKSLFEDDDHDAESSSNTYNNNKSAQPLLGAFSWICAAPCISTSNYDDVFVW